jgi:hypothetical protein
MRGYEKIIVAGCSSRSLGSPTTEKEDADASASVAPSPLPSPGAEARRHHRLPHEQPEQRAKVAEPIFVPLERPRLVDFDRDLDRLLPDELREHDAALQQRRIELHRGVKGLQRHDDVVGVPVPSGDVPAFVTRPERVVGQPRW